MFRLIVALFLLVAPAIKEAQPGLLARAKVAPEVARQAALALVKGGQVKSEEIEIENGKLVYSFDLSVKGKPGIQEVAIDALTGAVVENKHESPEEEAAETRHDLVKK